MSSFEIFLIVGFVLSPFLALIFVLPKKLKKESTPPATSEYKPEAKVEEKKEEPKETKPLENIKPAVSTDEFKDYLSHKRKNIKLPKHLNNPFMPTEDYVPSRLRRRKQSQENKSIAEQIQDLSPELKVMMFSGVFNKKDYND